mgnify:CR=1 FL=1
MKSFFEELGCEYQIEVTCSFKETVRVLLKNEFDFVLLDMTMPRSSNTSRTTKKKRSLAGKDVVSTLGFNNKTNIKFVIFSRFGEFGRLDEVKSLDEIYSEMVEEHEQIFLGCINYDTSDDESWKSQLLKIIKTDILSD